MALVDVFPNLAADGFRETSPHSRTYNCIAWAAGVDDRWWWPDQNEVSYWPDGIPRQETVEAFIAAFETLGYRRCADGILEPAFERIALYVREGLPTHAARQLEDGLWTSKLGESIDLTHTLTGIEGACYGKATTFMKRPRPSSKDGVSTSLAN